jgi:dipeptidyl aminopeptidase/acylaminoacyl peptidase
LTDVKQGAGNPVWSPEGTRLAFTSTVGGWEEPEKEEDKSKSKPARVISTLKYKSNDRGFVYDRRGHLFVVAADGGEARQITDGDWDDRAAAWSPDGLALAFVSARHAQRDFDNAADIWIVSVEGGAPRRVTDTVGPVQALSFAPNGAGIIYTGSRYRNEAGRNTRLFVVPVDGGPSRCLTPDLDRNVAVSAGGELCWVTNGTALIVAVEDQGNVHLYRVPVDSDDQGDLTLVFGGERQVARYSISADGAVLALAVSDATTPAEVFVINADGAAERQLTAINGDWRAEVGLAKPERFRYERAGYHLDGWVIKPFGYQPGRRYPALVNVHGGPMTQYGHTFFDEFQVQAGAGYAVIFTNPRGSQGYGETFTRAVVGDWGGGDYADVMAGVDDALRRYDFLDPARLGILGGSYGGYRTSWTVGHTERFAAACSERAVNNVLTLFGTSDIGHSFSEAQSGFLPWENMAWYVEHSPLTYAPRITTPLLILHSENDLRCPMEQAEQLYVALKKLHRDVMFVRFPDETHEMSRSGKPRHRLERFRIILEWFDRYLKPAPEQPAGLS